MCTLKGWSTEVEWAIFGGYWMICCRPEAREHFFLFRWLDKDRCTPTVAAPSLISMVCRWLWAECATTAHIWGSKHSPCCVQYRRGKDQRGWNPQLRFPWAAEGVYLHECSRHLLIGNHIIWNATSNVHYSNGKSCNVWQGSDEWCKIIGSG